MFDLTGIEEQLAAIGLTSGGWFELEPSDGFDPKWRTLLMVCHRGGTFWPYFSAWAEEHPDLPNPLDQWSHEKLGHIAAESGLKALFPDHKDPFYPFQKWARQADPDLSTSPLGLLIHPVFGLWSAWRGAFLLPDLPDLPAEKPSVPSPCLTCRDQPCLSACPVNAFLGTTPPQYDTKKCLGWIEGPAGKPCETKGCRARLACPVGQDYQYDTPQQSFHMFHFINGLKRTHYKTD